MNPPALPTETRVINTEDGESGVILDGFTWEPSTGEWTEYEVVTQYGIERWKRDDFVLASDLQNTD
jgi:hypothetical protein